MGLEKQENENLYAVVTKIAQKLNVNQNEIENVKRVGRERNADENKSQIVVVGLKNKSARDHWLSSRKTVISNDNIYNNGNGKPIYINENFTKYKRQLLWIAKKRLGESCKYIWIQNSNVLVRKNSDDSKIHKIKCESDIDKLQPVPTN